MERRLEERIETLEIQVQTLQHEVEELRGVRQLERNEEMESDKQSLAVVQQEQPIQLENAVPAQQDMVEPVQQATAEKPNHTLDQWLTTVLPKVFMIILVLGVLWGLKLASDYGIFSDTMKIIAGYTVSILLGAIGFWMEKKQKGSPQVAVILYAGAFMVGILTTAAGAILYDVLGLYVALLLAVIYIAYGIGISYVKGNEGVTSLVILTSFLLPYLLEYMDFNGYMIAGYICLLFAVIQIVIWKHHQHIALYIGAFFSVLSAIIIANQFGNLAIYFSLVLVLLSTIFIISAIQLFEAAMPRAYAYASATFSLLLFNLLGMHIVTFEQRDIFTVIGAYFVVLALASVWTWTQKKKQLFDVLVAVGLIALLTFVMNLQSTYYLDRLFVLVAAFAGLAIGIRLRATLLKITYSVFFTFIALIVVFSNRVVPFFSIENWTFLALIIMLAVLYWLMKKPLENPNRFEAFMQKVNMKQVMPVLVLLVVLLYSFKLDEQYLVAYRQPYLMMLLTLVTFTAILIFAGQHFGPWLLPTAAVMFIFVFFWLLFAPGVPVGEEFAGLILRFLYAAIIIAVVFDIWHQGAIYSSFAEWLDGRIDVAMIVGFILALLGIWSITNFAGLNEVLRWSISVMFTTIAIFSGAALALMLAGKRDYSRLRILGVVLLIFAIVKLIFFDLSSLDLLVRSVLFIIIGGAGLVLSNKLLLKKE